MDSLEITRDMLLLLEQVNGDTVPSVSLNDLLERYWNKCEYADLFDLLAIHQRMEHITVYPSNIGVRVKITDGGRRFLDGCRDEKRFELLKDIRDKLGQLVKQSEDDT